jgi:hypothetical protein
MIQIKMHFGMGGIKNNLEVFSLASIKTLQSEVSL